jgi:hemerythrin-like domain-containing protein
MTPKPDPEVDRRRFLRSVAAGGLLLATGGAAACARGAGSPAARGEREGEEEEVSPGEDLMREHGVLKRLLLVYGEAVRRLDAGLELPPQPVADAAAAIREFIEDYHEKLEEDHLFPRFEKAGKLVDLVRVLREQHRAGRRVTDVTLRLANARALRDAGERRRLAESLRQFIRMYEPHEAREDTVLFPAFHTIVSPHEYGALGEDFERREHQLFGADGFETMVDRVARIERALGIYDLAQFTPAP